MNIGGSKKEGLSFGERTGNENHLFFNIIPGCGHYSLLRFFSQETCRIHDSIEARLQEKYSPCVK